MESEEEKVVDLNGDESVITFTLPSFKRSDLERTYDFVNSVYDYQSLEELAQAINAARLALLGTTDKLNACERRGKKAKIAYERFWRRQYMLSNAKTDGARRIDADILAEEYEDQYLVYEQLSKELSRNANALRIELQTLQAIGNNIRQQLKMV